MKIYQQDTSLIGQRGDASIGYEHEKHAAKTWGYYNGGTTCECVLLPENIKHMLQCPILAQPCSLDDLLEFSGIAKNLVEHGKNRI